MLSDCIMAALPCRQDGTGHGRALAFLKANLPELLCLVHGFSPSCCRCCVEYVFQSRAYQQDP